MREILAFSVIGFWICFGFGIMFLNTQLSPNADFDLSVSTNPLTFIFDNAVLFFKCMFLFIPNVPLWASLIVTMIQLLSYIVVIFLIRS